MKETKTLSFPLLPSLPIQTGPKTFPQKSVLFWSKNLEIYYRRSLKMMLRRGRAASLVLGNSRLSSLNLNIAAACLHTCVINRNRWNPPPSSPLFNLTTRVQVMDFLAVRCKSGFDSVDDAHHLLHRMLQFKPPPSVADFNRLLTGVVNMKQFTSAVLLYRDMRFHGGVPINTRTMNIVINSLCSLNRVDFGCAILATIFKLGFHPDVVTLNTLIRGLFKANRFAEAIDLFRLMVFQKLCSDTTYGTVINGLCKSGNTSQALHLLRLVQKEGTHQPDTVMYNTIIDSLCKDRRVDEALHLLSEMSANGIPSNVITYNSVIQA